MHKKLLKNFAIIFSLLVLLEEVHCRTFLLKNQFEDSAKEREELRSRRHDHFHDADEFETPSERDSLEELLDDYIELTRKEAMNELQGKELQEVEKQDNEKRFLNTFFLVNGAINAAFDIYKYEKGCEDWTDLTNNLKEIESTIPRLIAKQDAINTAWTIFYTNYTYYERLHSQAVIVEEQASVYETLKRDVVLVIDPDIDAKIANATAELQSEIDTLNITDESVDYTYLENKFLTKFQLAYSLFKNLKSLAWMAAKGIVKKIIDVASSDEAAGFVNENPTRFERFLDYASAKKAQLENWYDETTAALKAKIEEFKVFIRTKFFEFIEAHPTLRNAYEYVAGDVASRARWLTIKNRLVTLGKGVIVAGFVAYDIYLLADFINTCNKRQDQSQVLLNYLKGNESYLDTLQAEVDGNITALAGNYSTLKAKFETTNFTAYLNSVQELITNSSDPTPSQLEAVSQIQTFIVGIKDANQEMTNTLVESLISALNKTNVDIKCLYEKLHIIQDAYGRCSKGYDTFSNIFTNAQTRDQNEVASCYSTGYLNEADLKSFIYSQLADNSKQNVCIWNSETKKEAVCREYFTTIKTNSELATDLSLSVADVTYFITQCGSNTITVDNTKLICDKKSIGENVSTIFSTYFSAYGYSESEITAVYASCSLISSQISDICRRKGLKMTVATILTTYSEYDSTMVTTEFNACLPTDSTKALICQVYGFSNQRDTDYNTIYSTTIMDEVYAGCSSRDAASDLLSIRKMNEVKNSPIISTIGHVVAQALGINLATIVPPKQRDMICALKQVHMSIHIICIVFKGDFTQQAIKAVYHKC